MFSVCPQMGKLSKDAWIISKNNLFPNYIDSLVLVGDWCSMLGLSAKGFSDTHIKSR